GKATEAGNRAGAGDRVVAKAVVHYDGTGRDGTVQRDGVVAAVGVIKRDRVLVIEIICFATIVPVLCSSAEIVGVPYIACLAGPPECQRAAADGHLQQVPIDGWGQNGPSNGLDVQQMGAGIGDR